MLAGKTPAELLELKKLGLDKPVAWDFFRGGAASNSDDEEFHDAADDAVDSRHPLAELDEEPVQESELAEICEAFERALIWAGQAKSLVEMGWRLTTMIAVMRPALLEGMALEAKREQKRELVKTVGGKQLAADVGGHYRKVLAWCRRCDSLAQLGQRGFAMIYVIKRAAIDGLTNACLGALNNKTRQAFNKTVQDFRDSHGGYRNEVMRGEETRTRCRMAQTLNS